MASICVSVDSPAKINWQLRVLGRRGDGYHEIESLVSAVTLYDRLWLTERPEAGIEIECDQPDVPIDGTNLIARAAAGLARAAGCPCGVHCRLSKAVPVGGGLGGGSSNAAAALKGLNRLWGLNWRIDRLAPLAAELGSDVPFFLHGTTALIRGRGERVEPAELGWHGAIVLILPGFSVSTARVYQAWQTTGAACDGAAVGGMTPGDAVAWMAQTRNMLEPPAIRVAPKLGRLLTEASRLAGRVVRLSGSGSTLFTAFDDRAHADHFARSAEHRLAVRTHVVEPVVPGQAPGPYQCT